MEFNKVYQGDVLEVLKTFPDECIDCVITSPPYWGLRTYSVEGQLGLEPTAEEYIKKLCNIFDEVKRVLKKTGTCFVNLGDTYGGTGDKGNWKDPKYPNGRNGQTKAVNKTAVSKSLGQIPSRFAIKMTDTGWLLRNEIIWFKTNAMPSSVKDRFSVDFEKVFFFTKNKKYFFDQDSVREECKTGNGKAQGIIKGKRFGGEGNAQGVVSGFGERVLYNHSKGRNKRCVWTVPLQPFKGNHFACYPRKLIEPMVKSGCPDNGVILDPFMGSGTTAIVAEQFGKQWVGIELNNDYIKMAYDRIEKERLKK